MTQETRKDPRAKVLTMTVRYKSATLDEFIEHHSYDVSRGGMFIKTPSPFPPGTLLKFEVKISGEQRVMQGVGRVVWKRESSEVTEARPAGMGVKFIKIDDESRKVIDQLVAARGDGASAFDQGNEGAAARQAPAREISSQVVAPSLSAREPAAASSKPRKATMLGLGAMQAEPESPETAAAEAFFPPTQPEQQMPPPEDRTVMKQAAELLQDALREAGGSLEEVGAAKASPAREVPKTESQPASPPPAAVPKVEAEVTPAPAPVAAKTEKVDKAAAEKPAERSVIVNARPRDEVTQPAVRRASVAPAARRSEPPKARPAAIQEKSTSAAKDSGGGGRFALALIAVAAVGAVIFFLRKTDTPTVAPEPPPAAETPAAVPEPAPEPTPAPAPTTEAPAAASAAPEGSAATSAAPPAAPEPPAPAARAEPPKAPAAKPAPVRPAPKPAVPKAPAAETPAPAEPTQPTQPTAPTQPTEPAAPTAAPTTAAPAPEAPKPVETPKPPAAPKPAPAEKSGDNPY